MYNKKTLSKATAELDKAKAPAKPKDIITDPMGQWKYPGLPTRIPGNDITMEGVGYPVLGVANNGQRKIMLPGADYTFPGADYVDEYPQMKKGGTSKSKSGTITNVKQKPDGSKTVQVKTKDGKYYEKVIPMDYWGELDQAKEAHNLENTHEKALNYTGVVAYPASVISSIADFRDGKYTEGSLGLIPFVGRNSKLAKTAARAVEESALNAGIPLTKALLKARSVRTLLPGITGATQMQDIIPHEKDGGYIETDLTEDEIEEHRKGGYIVEDISVPELNQAQKGGTKTHKSADGTTTNTITKANGDVIIQVKTKDGRYTEKMIPAAQQKAWDELGKKLTIPNQKISESMGEAQQMMDSGELDYETWNERKAKNQREVEAHKQERLNALAKNEARYMDPRYSQLTGLPGESWRDKLANDVGATGAKFRVSQEDNFFDDYINPAVMIGSMAQSLGEAPKKAKESDSYMPYVTSIGSPLLAGALGGLGAKNNKQFINNVVNPLAGVGTKGKLSKPSKTIAYKEELQNEYWPKSLTEHPDAEYVMQKTPVKDFGIKPNIKNLPTKQTHGYDINEKDVHQLINQNLEYLTHPNYIKRRQSVTGETTKQIKKDIDSYINNLKKSDIDLGLNIEYPGGHIRGDRKWFLGKKSKDVTGVNPDKVSSRTEALHVLDHEIGHALSPANQSTFKGMPKYKNYPNLKISKKIDKDGYLGSDYEQQVRFNRIKNYLNNKYGISKHKPITEKDFDLFANDYNKWVNEEHMVQGKGNMPRGMQDIGEMLTGHTQTAGQSAKTRRNIIAGINRSWALAPVGITGAALMNMPKQQKAKQMKKGGMVAELTPNEIQEYINQGYIVEEH
jgi:hypothetical protein